MNKYQCTLLVFKQSENYNSYSYPNVRVHGVVSLPDDKSISDEALAMQWAAKQYVLRNLVLKHTLKALETFKILEKL